MTGRSLRSIAVAAALFSFTSTASAVVLPGVDAHCRYRISNAATTYADYLTQRMVICHRNRMRGKIPASINCNDPSTWAANGYPRGAALMQKTIEKVTKLANACDPVGGTPASVGYMSCPAPCNAMPMSTFTEVADCMRCLIDSCALPNAVSVNGTPPLPISYLAGHCQLIIGRELHTYMVKRAFLKADCQFNQERGKPGYIGVDCDNLDDPGNPMHSMNARALLEADTKITDQCDAPVDMASEIDSCATAPAAEVTCVTDSAAQCADIIYSAAFPPP